MDNSKREFFNKYPDIYKIYLNDFDVYHTINHLSKTRKTFEEWLNALVINLHYRKKSHENEIEKYYQNQEKIL